MSNSRSPWPIWFVLGLLLAAYLIGYVRIRSNSFEFANRLYFGVRYEQLASGVDPIETTTGRLKINALGWLYLPCILVDERRDETILRIEFPSRPEKL